MPTRHTGFTLVEIAIVLLIISLLMGGVLKGQELIDSARVKNLSQDLRTIPALIHAYQDKFRALPGDDPAALRHLCGSAGDCTAAGDGNGAIGGKWDDTGASESVLLWQHLRLANLASGSTDVDDAGYLPRNSLGGRVGVQRGGAEVLGVKGSVVVCSAGIPGKLVRQLDITLDDGNPASGAVRAGLAGSTALSVVDASAPLDDDAPHTVCANL